MFDRIIHPTDTLSIAGEAVGTVSLGALSATIANGNIVPGTLLLDGATEDYTDNGDGTMTGSVSGTATINYRTGAVVVAGGTNEAVVGSYDYFSPGATQETDIANAVTPQFMSFRNEAGEGGMLLMASSDGTNYEQYFTKGGSNQWHHADIGLVPLAWLRVYSSSKGRLIGRPVNPT